MDEDARYAEIARKDFEREIYRQCDEEDKLENDPHPMTFFEATMIALNHITKEEEHGWKRDVQGHGGSSQDDYLERVDGGTTKGMGRIEPNDCESNHSED